MGDNTVDNQKISGVFKKLLFVHDLTPMELSRRIDVSQPSLQRIFRGTQKHSRKSSLTPIAEYFGITMEQLNGNAPIRELEAVPAIRPSAPLIDWKSLPEYLNNHEIPKAKRAWHPILSNVSSQIDFAIAIDGDLEMTMDFVEGMVLLLQKGDITESAGYALVFANEEWSLSHVKREGENTFYRNLKNQRYRSLKQGDKIYANLIAVDYQKPASQGS